MVGELIGKEGRRFDKAKDGKYYRERQPHPVTGKHSGFHPSLCRPGTFVTKKQDGHRVVLCKIGKETTTKAQSLLHPLSEAKHLGITNPDKLVVVHEIPKEILFERSGGIGGYYQFDEMFDDRMKAYDHAIELERVKDTYALIITAALVRGNKRKTVSLVYVLIK